MRTAGPSSTGSTSPGSRSASAAPHTSGAVYLQRFAVGLDRRKDPTTPPTAAGLDGATTGSNAQQLIAASGRDPSVAGLIGAANETVVAWVDTSVAGNRINLQIFSDAGVLATSLNNIGTTTATGELHVQALAGGGFAVVWMASVSGNLVLQGRVYTPGVAAGTFVAGGVTQFADIDDDASDFTIAALPDGGGFGLSWIGTDAGQPTVFSRSFNAGGAPQEATAAGFHIPAAGTGLAAAGLIGDRMIVAYADGATPGNPNVGARILDTRTLGDGSDIVLGGPGLTLVGDPEFETRGRIAPDILVGSIGNDTIDGRQGDDILDGGLGDDSFVAGAGNDSIDGGGGNDSLTLTGRFTLDGVSADDDYAISYLGGGMFSLTDLRGGAPDGSDIARSIESFTFLGSATTYSLAQLLGADADVTPTAWGWTDEDADAAPNAAGLPDIDGFIVNHAPTSSAGIQTNPFAADSVGEFIGVVWETAVAPGAATAYPGSILRRRSARSTGSSRTPSTSAMGSASRPTR